MPKLIEGLREEIIECAKRNLQGDNPDFSLRVIAKDCNVAIGTIYNYFSDKESILIAVMVDEWLRRLNNMEEIIANSDDPEEGFVLIRDEVYAFIVFYAPIWMKQNDNLLGGQFHTQHFQLKEGIGETIEKLLDKFEIDYDDNTCEILAELIITISFLRDVEDNDLRVFFRRLFSDSLEERDD